MEINKTIKKCGHCGIVKARLTWYPKGGDGQYCGRCYLAGLDKPPPIPAKPKARRCRYCCKKKYQKEWAEGPQCVECIEKYGHRGKPQKRGAYRRYKEKKESARRRGHKWRLSPAEFYLLAEQNCFYCGQEPKLTANGKVGIDRIDSLGDYTRLNVVPSCGTCNRTKGFLSMEEFAEWLKNAAKYKFWERNLDFSPAKRFKTKMKIIDHPQPPSL